MKYILMVCIMLAVPAASAADTDTKDLIQNCKIFEGSSAKYADIPLEKRNVPIEELLPSIRCLEFMHGLHRGVLVSDGATRIGGGKNPIELSCAVEGKNTKDLIPLFLAFAARNGDMVAKEDLNLLILGFLSDLNSTPKPCVNP